MVDNLNNGPQFGYHFYQGLAPGIRITIYIVILSYRLLVGGVSPW